MQIVLDPGKPPAPVAPEGALIPIAQTMSPARLSDLLAELDTDTRDYLQSLLGAVERGTERRGSSMRRMLVALGPTTAQVRAITTPWTGVVTTSPRSSIRSPPSHARHPVIVSWPA